jgi:hypothetical protein
VILDSSGAKDKRGGPISTPREQFG